MKASVTTASSRSLKISRAPRAASMAPLADLRGDGWPHGPEKPSRGSAAKTFCHRRSSVTASTQASGSRVTQA